MSSALHESQSRLWENVVGRSLPFWSWFYPRVLRRRSRSGSAASRSRASTGPSTGRAARSSASTADETSYGLHVILRFELEQELISGRLAVADLPDAWNARFEELMGVAVPNDALGVLQDAHWSGGGFGYFPTYLLGTVLSVQIWEKARAAIPDVDEQIGRGEFGELHTWLRENIYALGRKLTPAETRRARRRRPDRPAAVPRATCATSSRLPRRSYAARPKRFSARCTCSGGLDLAVARWRGRSRARRADDS